MTATAIKLDPKTVYRLLSDSACLATVLHVICLAKYGEEIYQLDPLELYLRLEEDFGVRLPEECENRLNAILLATSTDIFYQNAEAFRGISNTLTDGDPGLDYLESPTLAEMTWALYEVDVNHGEMAISKECERLIAAAMDNEADDDDPSTVEDPESVGDLYASLKAFMRDQHGRLCRQLAELGIPNRDVPPLEPAEIQQVAELALA